jgi:TRAP-type uncharacterized transport system substrate-binding protein
MLTRSHLLLTSVVALLFFSTSLAQTPAKEGDCSRHERNTLELRTGKAGLYYDLVGSAIEKSFNKQKASDIPKIKAVCGRGSAENIQELGESAIPFAIVQSDVAHGAWYGHPRMEACPERGHAAGVFPSDVSVCDVSEPGCARKTSRPVVITPLYSEAMHILIRPHFNISTLQDLQGRRVWAGGIGSGARFSAERVFSAAGVSFCSVVFVEDLVSGGEEISEKEALQRLGEMQIDAVFVTGPVPTHQLEDVLDRFPEIHFFPLAYDLVQKLTQDESFTEALIRGKDYGKRDSTLTVGVEALLMTNENVDPKAVRALADFIHGNGQELRDSLRDRLETQKATEHDDEISDLAAHPAALLRRVKRWGAFKYKKEIANKATEATDSGSGETVDLTFDEKKALKDHMESEEAHDAVARLPLLNLPTPDALVPDFYSGDPVVKQYFSRPRSATWKRQLVFVLAGCLLLLASLFAWMRRKLRRILMRQPDAALATIATILLWTLGSYLLYHYEGLVNEDFSHLWESFGAIFLYFVPFLGKKALTPSGQQTIQVLQWLGLALLGGFLSPFVRKLLATDLWGPFIAWLQGRPIMQNDVTGHFVIINWDHRGRDIVHHLNLTQAAAGRVIVVVTPTPVDFTDESYLEEIVGVVGDATQFQCLEKARVPFAHSVTLLSAWKPSDSNDRRQSLDRDVADTRTIQTLRAIRDLCARQELPPRPAVTAEIRSSWNKQEAERAGGAEIEVEIVCVDSLSNDVLVQTALTPGIATLYTHLMNMTAEGTGSDTGVFRTTVPRALVGSSFGELLAHFARRRGHGPAGIPIAVGRASHVFVNPPDQKLGKLEEGDILFIVADRQPTETAPAPPTARASVA